MMRILMVTPHLNLRKGPYVWVREIVKKLSEKSIEAHVLVYNENVSEKNVISYNKIFRFEKVLFKYPIFSLAKIIRTSNTENQYDIIHAIDPLTSGFNAVRVGKETKTPSVITLHSEYFTEIKTWSSEQVVNVFSMEIPPLASLGIRILDGIGKYSMSNTDRLVVPNNYLKKYLKNHSLESQVIPNGVNIDDFKGEVTKTDDKKTILSISHMKIPKKVEGLKLLIDAMLVVQVEEPDAKLRIVGDGMYLPMLKKYSIKKKVNIDFLGFREDIPDLLADCTIYVHSSLLDIFPLVILEAMASKRPIVATKVGGIPELITNNENGLLCEPTSTEISKSILLLLKDEKLRTKFGNAGFEMVKERYTWDKVTEEYIRLYENLSSK